LSRATTSIFIHPIGFRRYIFVIWCFS